MVPVTIDRNPSKPHGLAPAKYLTHMAAMRGTHDKWHESCYAYVRADEKSGGTARPMGRGGTRLATCKWLAMLRLRLPFGFRAAVALLRLRFCLLRRTKRGEQGPRNTGGKVLFRRSQPGP